MKCPKCNEEMQVRKVMVLDEFGDYIEKPVQQWCNSCHQSSKKLSYDDWQLINICHQIGDHRGLNDIIAKKK